MVYQAFRRLMVATLLLGCSRPATQRDLVNLEHLTVRVERHSVLRLFDDDAVCLLCDSGLRERPLATREQEGQCTAEQELSGRAK